MKIKQVPGTTPKSSKILAIKLGIFHQKLCKYSSYYYKSMSEELLCYIYWCKVVLKAAA